MSQMPDWSQFPVYYFDRLKIFIPRPTFSFGGPVIQNAELKNLCLKSKIRSSFMGCTLDIHLPNEKCLPFLHNRLKKVYYYISYLEIAADFLYQSKKTVIKKAKMAAKKICVKYINHHKACIDQKSSPDERFFANDIWYWGTTDSKRKFVMYTPYSKPLLPKKVPCIHTEWRLKGSNIIKKYAKASSLEDLIYFNFDQFYENQCRRMRFVKIDHQAHGFYLLAPSSRNRHSGKNKKAELDISRKFCLEKRIAHPVHLLNYYTKKQREKRMSQGGKLSYYKIASFLKEAKAPRFLARYI